MSACALFMVGRARITASGVGTSLCTKLPFMHKVDHAFAAHPCGGHFHSTVLMGISALSLEVGSAAKFSPHVLAHSSYEQWRRSASHVARRCRPTGRESIASPART